MHVLKDICSVAEYQLEDAAKKRDWTESDIDLVYKLVKTMYYIKCIDAMEDSFDDGYSRDGRGGASYRRGRSYDYDYESSMRRGRSREDGKDAMRELNDMMSKASSDIERQVIGRMMDRLG